MWANRIPWLAERWSHTELHQDKHCLDVTSKSEHGLTRHMNWVSPLTAAYTTSLCFSSTKHLSVPCSASAIMIKLLTHGDSPQEESAHKDQSSHEQGRERPRHTSVWRAWRRSVESCKDVNAEETWTFSWRLTPQMIETWVTPDYELERFAPIAARFAYIQRPRAHQCRKRYCTGVDSPHSFGERSLVGVIRHEIEVTSHDILQRAIVRQKQPVHTRSV